jgi:DeoR/GlpR family transcriptional regulator of sugar metabolism
MPANRRAEQIVALLDERGFISVKELSELCGVSEMTIRRDLQRLDSEERVRRTYGGVMSLYAPSPAGTKPEDREEAGLQSEGTLLDSVDVVIASSVDPKYDRILLDRVEKRNVPIIAESASAGRDETLVSVESYQAGLALGRWAGEYAQQKWDGHVFALDLTYHLPNTQARSHGFVAGLREILPKATEILSLDAQSRYSTAYKLTTDALTVHPHINMIFAINDTTAAGAMQACRDLDLPSGSVLVLPFGLEGDMFRNALSQGECCQAGLAMFPEIAGPLCIEAAIAAFNKRPLNRQIVVPHAVLTPDTLFEFYSREENSWRIRWDTVREKLAVPLQIERTERQAGEILPKRIGFIVPFREHQWYENLSASMQAHAESLGIGLEIVDAARSREGEMELRRRGIAQLAAGLVQPGDAILLDSGPIMIQLAEALAPKGDITVITNSVPAFDRLKRSPGLTLISTGGLWRPSTGTLIGPTAEGALKELRVDKLFLVVTGLTLDFGLSHSDLTEVAVKQAMIRAAREVILLADHMVFEQASVAQVAATTVVHRLITDEALPASTRLELAKQGIEVLVASV